MVGEPDREAIAALKADRNNQLIAYIIQDIIKDAIECTGKKGRGRGRRNGAVLGFLSEISETIAATQLLSSVGSLHDD